MSKHKNHISTVESPQAQENTVVYFSFPELTKEELEQYAGMEVAIVDGKVVAAGHTATEALKKARELFPNRSLEEILIDFISDEEVLIVCGNMSSLTKLTEEKPANSFIVPPL